MRGIKKYLVGSALSVAMFFAGAAQAPAMEMTQFDQMSADTQGSYEAFLVVGVLRFFNAQNDQDMAQKTFDLFTKKPAGATKALGTTQFIKNLAIVRAINKKNENDPSKPPLKVEHAFFVVLKDNGIHVSVDDLLAIGQDFKPGAPGGSSNGTSVAQTQTAPIPSIQ